MFAVTSAGFGARAITVSLWCGLILLTVWLLLLARTRWGHARPLAKCAALSLFVHLLFCIYAYGTRIFVDYPVAGASPTRVVLTMAADDRVPPDEDDTEPQRTLPDEWTNPFEEPVTEPAPSELPRTELEESPEFETAPADDRSMDVADAVPLPAAEETESAADEPEPVPDAPAEIPAAAEAVAMQPHVEPVEVAESTPMPEEPIPPTAELPRQSVDDVAANSDDQSTTGQVEDESNTGESETATLDEQLFADDSSQARADDQDQTQSSAPAEGIEHASDDESSMFENPASVALRSRPAPAARQRRPGDGAEMPLAYQARAAEVREAQLQAMGGDAQTEEAVERALAWLAANQSEDGHWNAAAFGAGEERMVLGHNRGGAGAKANTGITALALLSFFGAGHTHFDGPYRKNVQHGLEYLLRSQRADGSLSGDAELFAAMYCHGIAFLALSEAFAMTGDARLKPYVERAQQFTLRSQIPYDGGWRYQAGDNQGDMSQFGWQVMALRSAEVAGVSIPQDARQGMLRFMNTVCSGQHQGRASYRVNTRTSRTMTAEAMTCRYFLQLNPTTEQRREAADFLMEEIPGAEPANFYYWYYGSLAMQQMQDQRWPQWNEALKTSLLERQRTDGELAGSWDPNTVWGGYGGRVYTTAMAAMCLEVYYRYLPVYQSGIAEQPGRPIRR